MPFILTLEVAGRPRRKRIAESFDTTPLMTLAAALVLQRDSGPEETYRVAFETASKDIVRTRYTIGIVDGEYGVFEFDTSRMPVLISSQPIDWAMSRLKLNPFDEDGQTDAEYAATQAGRQLSDDDEILDGEEL